MDLSFRRYRVAGHDGAVLNDINDDGVVVGVIQTEDERVIGFVDRGEGPELIDIPNAVQTHVQCVDATGCVAGDFVGEDKRYRGFVRRGGSLEIIDVPDATQTFISGCRSDGALLGTFDAADGRRRGFVLAADGTYSPVDFPNAETTLIYGANERGSLVGGYLAESSGDRLQPFCRKNGEFQRLPAPDDAGPASAYDISNRGQIVGQWFRASAKRDSDGGPYGYLIDDEALRLLDVPEARHLGPLGINSSGVIVGFFDNLQDGRREGFYLELE